MSVTSNKPTDFGDTLDRIKNKSLSLKANKPTDDGDTLMHVSHSQGNKEDIILLHK